MALKVLLAVCVFNEGIKLEWTLERMRKFIRDSKDPRVEYQILISDDASTDGMPEKQAQKGDILLLRSERRLGVGACMRINLKVAREKGFDVIVYLAGNNKDNPDEIPVLLKPVLEEGCDLVQGSRYLKGGKAGNMPAYRQFATRFHPVLFSFFVHRHLTDTTNGFRAIKLSILDDARIDLDQDWLNHYELEPYLLFKAIVLGYKVKEVPVSKIYPPKHLGYSKMKPIIGWWSILRPVLYLGLNLRK